MHGEHHRDAHLGRTLDFTALDLLDCFLIPAGHTRRLLKAPASASTPHCSPRTTEWLPTSQLIVEISPLAAMHDQVRLYLPGSSRRRALAAWRGHQGKRGSVALHAQRAGSSATRSSMFWRSGSLTSPARSLMRRLPRTAFAEQVLLAPPAPGREFSLDTSSRVRIELVPSPIKTSAPQTSRASIHVQLTPARTASADPVKADEVQDTQPDVSSPKSAQEAPAKEADSVETAPALWPQAQPKTAAPTSKAPRRPQPPVTSEKLPVSTSKTP